MKGTSKSLEDFSKTYGTTSNKMVMKEIDVKYGPQAFYDLKGIP